jgi:lambda family phage portal protein
MLNTLAAYTIGSGPTLQLTSRTSPELRNVAKQVEQHWSDWAYERKLSQKLLTLQQATDADGEAFAVFTSGKANMHTPISLDVRLYEADHFELFTTGTWYEDDAGIRIDSNGEPVAYAFSPDHPGDSLSLNVRPQWLPADSVIHLFRKERPGQLRGIPKTTPALPLFAMLRRFTLATVVAAETAADFAAIISSEHAAEGDDIIEPWDRLNIERGAMVSLPGGTNVSQLRAEHPNATFDEFCKAILREIARCLGLPAVLALGDSSGANYASGRLDLQAFNRQMEVERSALIERDCLDRIFEAWLDEALLIPNFLPPEFVDNISDIEWAWRWQQPGHVDRAKEAAGQAAELDNHTTTLAREYARQGLDWENELRQRARELATMRELGLSPTEEQPTYNEDDEDE